MRLGYLVCCLLGNAVVALAASGQPASSRRLELPNQYVSPTVETLQNLDERRLYGDWPWGSDGLTGGWGGLRGRMERRGLRLFAQYTSISMVNVQGGLDQGYYGGAPLGVTLTADLRRLVGLPGASLFVDWEYFGWYNSRFAPTGRFDPTGSYVGDNTNLIDEDDPVLNQIAQLFWGQQLLDGLLAVQFGKMDVNAAFAVVGAAGAFQNSIAMFTSTLNPFMATYPNETTGLQIATQPTQWLSGLFGWFDGTGAGLDPTTGREGPATGSRGPSTFFQNEGHWFLIAEGDVDWQLDPTRPGTAGIGGWLQTGHSSTEGDSDDGVTDVPGFYLQATQTLWTASSWLAARGGGIQVFGQYGWSPAEKNPVNWSIMAGVSATGVVPGRPADAMGLLGSHSRFTDDPGVFRSTDRNGLSATSGGVESNVEAFYLLQLLPWLYVQPGIQWIGTPGGGNPAPLDDALMTYLLVSVWL